MYCLRLDTLCVVLLYNTLNLYFRVENTKTFTAAMILYSYPFPHHVSMCCSKFLIYMLYQIIIIIILLLYYNK